MSVSARAEQPKTLGRYELITPIGRGGMADVHLAIQRGPAGFEKLVVLKLVHEELASEKAFVDMLLDEAKLAALIKHPNVVDVYELGEADGHYFIAMEYLEGEPLLAVLEAGHSGRRLDPLSMTRLIADAAEGLEAAHQLKSRDGRSLGVVHHDISLGNIFVLYSGQVKLLDFGVAKATRKRKATSPEDDEKVFGKLAYMAPEKLDERPGDKRSDIWSLGCVLWEALTHKRLFKGANDIEIVREVRYVNVPPPSQVSRDIPRELDAIVLKALQRDPFKRYQSARDLGVALEEVLTAKAYGAKNYRITAYMQATFADHIAARELLLREISGTARPSAQLIDAAFGDPQSKKESTLPSIEHILNPTNTVTLPEDHTGAEALNPFEGAATRGSTVNPFEGVDTAPTRAATATEPDRRAGSVANPFEEPEEIGATTFDDVPANAEASRTVRGDANPSWARGKVGESLKELQRKLQERREHPERRYAKVPYAIGAAIAIVLAIVLVVKCGGDKTSAPAAKTPAASPPTQTPPPGSAAIAPAPAPGSAAVVADETPPELEEIEMQPDAPRKARPKPKQSAETLYAAGLDHMRKNDHRAALAAFTDARRANPSFAPAWYGLGLVHEKLGKRGAAKAAYQRYLSLAPKASNAAQVRERIENL